MNYSKYHQTANFTSGAASGSTSSHAFGSAVNRGSSSNSRVYQTGAGPGGRQEQSVERLKSCIADLKKLATNKVKRGSSTAPGMSSGVTGARKDRHAQEDPRGEYQYNGSQRDREPASVVQQHAYPTKHKPSANTYASTSSQQAIPSSKRPSKSNLHGSYQQRESLEQAPQNP